MTEIASPGQLRMGLVRWALVTVPLTLLLGFLSGQVGPSGDESAWFRALEKPWFNPPGWVFPVAWTLLYAMIGFALAVVLHARGAKGRGLAIALWLAQFALNLAWSPTFFGAQRITAALVIIVAMFVLALATTFAFGRVRPLAAWLMVPYLGWLVFAGLLNLAFARLNPEADALAPRGVSTDIPLK